MLKLKNVLLSAFLIACLALLAGCQAPEPAAPAEPAAPDYAAEYCPMLDTVFEVWNSKDYPALHAIMTDDFVRDAPDQNTQGKEEHQAFMEGIHATYPDFKIVSRERAYAENLAFVHWIVTGTEAASGNAVEVSGISLMTIEGGKFTSEAVRFDMAALQAQLAGE